MATITRTRVHVFTTFADPFLVCECCGATVSRFHNHERCGCGDPDMDRNECCGAYGERSVCPSWGPVDGCQCMRIFGYVQHMHPEQRARIAADVAKVIGLSPQ